MLHIQPTNLQTGTIFFFLFLFKAYLSTKNIEEFSGKKSREWDSRQKKKDKTERVTRFGKRTRQEIVKWPLMTALRFQRGGGEHQTSPASLRGARHRMELPG